MYIIAYGNFLSVAINVKSCPIFSLAKSLYCTEENRTVSEASEWQRRPSALIIVPLSPWTLSANSPEIRSRDPSTGSWLVEHDRTVTSLWFVTDMFAIRVLHPAINQKLSLPTSDPDSNFHSESFEKKVLLYWLMEIPVDSFGVSLRKTEEEKTKPCLEVASLSWTLASYLVHLAIRLSSPVVERPIISPVYTLM